MLINWFTVIAQIINFLILVWLLKRYLYKPILNAIDEREKRIATRISDAEKKETEAEKNRDEFQKKKDELDRQQNALMNKAAEDAKAERERLMEEARKEAAALQQKLEDLLGGEQQRLSDVIARRTKNEVFEIARKTLKDLANLSLEQQMTNVFITRLKNLDEEEKKKLVAAFGAAQQQITVHSTFALSTTQQQEIIHAVNDSIGAAIQWRFETTPDIVSGIELDANGYKIAWSISEYLKALENSVTEVMKLKQVNP